MKLNTWDIYSFLIVIDFEATCESTNPNNFDHEIIEFPVVVIDTEKKAIVSIGFLIPK